MTVIASSSVCRCGSFVSSSRMTREHDRGEAARPEPAEEPQGLTASAASQHRERDRQHAHHRQAEDGIEPDLPGQLVQQRAEDHRPEDREGHRVEQLATLVDQVGHLAAGLAVHAPNRKPPVNAAMKMLPPSALATPAASTPTRGSGSAASVARSTGGARRASPRYRPALRPRRRRSARSRSAPARAGLRSAPKPCPPPPRRSRSR